MQPPAAPLDGWVLRPPAENEWRAQSWRKQALSGAGPAHFKAGVPPSSRPLPLSLHGQGLALTLWFTWSCPPEPLLLKRRLRGWVTALEKICAVPKIIPVSWENRAGLPRGPAGASAGHTREGGAVLSAILHEMKGKETHHRWKTVVRSHFPAKNMILGVCSLLSRTLQFQRESRSSRVLIRSEARSRVTGKHPRICPLIPI